MPRATSRASVKSRRPADWTTSGSPASAARAKIVTTPLPPLACWPGPYTEKKRKHARRHAELLAGHAAPQLGDPLGVAVRAVGRQRLILAARLGLERVDALAGGEHEDRAGRAGRLERVQRAARVQLGVADRIAARFADVAAAGQVHHGRAVAAPRAQRLAIGAHVARDAVRSASAAERAGRCAPASPRCCSSASVWRPIRPEAPVTRTLISVAPGSSRAPRPEPCCQRARAAARSQGSSGR